MLKQFKEFIMRGNVLDLAVAVIIGGAFGKIVSSLVNDLLMPGVGLALGKVDFLGLAWTVGGASVNYGLFIQSIMDFLIVAFVIFLVVKSASAMKKPEPVAAPTTKNCPYCFSTVHIQATRCRNCTSELK